MFRQKANENSGVVLWSKDYFLLIYINFAIALTFHLTLALTSDYTIFSFGVNEREAGFAAGIFIAGSTVSRLLAGRLFTLASYKKVLLISICVVAFACVGYFFADGIVVFDLVRIIHGVAFGISATAAITIAMGIIPKDKGGQGIGYFTLSQIISSAVGPYLAMSFSRNENYTALFSICLVVAIVGVVFVLLLRTQDNQDSRVAKDTKVGKSGSLNLIDKNIFPVGIMAFPIFVSFAGISSFLIVYANEKLFTETAQYYFAIYGIIVIVTRPLVGKLYDSRGLSIVMYPGMAFFAANFFFLSQANNNSYFIVLSAVCVGIGMGALQVLMLTIIANVTPKERLGLANSTYYAFADGGTTVGPIVMGILITFLGYEGSYLVFFFVAASSIVQYAFLNAKYKQRR